MTAGAGCPAGRVLWVDTTNVARSTGDMDDRWLQDRLLTARRRDAVAAVERDLDAVCAVFTRRDAELALGRELTAAEWEAVGVTVRRLWSYDTERALHESVVWALSDAS